MPLNISDRKVVDTGTKEASKGDFRVPEVQISGRELSGLLDPPDAGASLPGESRDLGVPRDIRVESQKVRVQPDGSAVVDVVLSYEPAEGAASHEVRVTKI